MIEDASQSSFMVQSMTKIGRIMDNYGAAYMMGSRLMGCSVVTTLYFLIKQGVDVMPILSYLGVGELGTTMGTYAAAIVFSSAFYPVTLGLSGYLVPIVAKTRRMLLP